MATRLDGKSLVPKWTIEISSFNTCPCLREGSLLYVTASGFIGKIDLDKGQYKWSIKLDEPYDGFEVPRLLNNKLILKENIEGTKKAKARIIEINKETGEILKK
jgi:outer membrane protein assembly factor BamB